MLLTHSNLFAPVDLKRRVFRKVAGGRPCATACWSLTEAGERHIGQPEPREERLRDAAFEASPVAQIVVDAAGYLVLANSRARALFDLRTDDLGRPFQDLEISYRPVELRSQIEQVYTERRPSRSTRSSGRPPRGEVVHLEVQILPLVDDNQALLGASITFADLTRSRRLRRSWSRPTRSWRTPTRSCSRPTRSWRPPTRSCSRRSRSWRPPTRSCSRPTKSWRR